MNFDNFKELLYIQKKIDLSKIKTNSNWHFKKCDPRFGFKYPGRIPGQIYIILFGAEKINGTYN